jgi:hypothetical protein
VLWRFESVVWEPLRGLIARVFSFPACRDAHNKASAFDRKDPSKGTGAKIHGRSRDSFGSCCEELKEALKGGTISSL